MLPSKSVIKLQEEPSKIIIGFLFIMFIGVLALNLSKSKAAFKNSEITELNFIQENTLIGVWKHYYITPREKAIELLLEEIKKRESGGDPNACNGSNCEKGRGHYQIVSGTEKDCEKALGKEIDPFDPVEAKQCALWLLDTRGIWPWEPYSGSYISVLLELDLYDEMYLNPGSIKI